MAHLTKPVKYNIEDSNIALFGSNLEKRVHEHAGDIEHAWTDAGLEPGLQVWRVEKFTVVDWPKERHGSFYDGDSYIVLHTYKKDPDSEALYYDLHFWLGENTSQDEAGTAAYKTVELDDHLKGRPVQHREVQGFESVRFISYFPQFTTLRGGVSTGFHHVTAPPPDDISRLYRVGVVQDHAHPGKSVLLVREVPSDATSLERGDVFVLDKGAVIWQLNTRDSVGKEKFRAAEFVQSIVNERKGPCESTVFDEGGSGAGIFLSALGLDVFPTRSHRNATSGRGTVKLFRLSDSTGTMELAPASSLSSDDAFLLDAATDDAQPAVYVWIGRNASLKERRSALQYAQAHLYEKRRRGEIASAGISVVAMREGSESDDFTEALTRS
ncbi:fragmin60 [Amylostereum chailletii]|nr:fragmin60 [Amylostereum chailletii]